MNDVLFPESWRLLARGRGAALVLRLLVVVGPTAAVGCTWLAAGRTVALLDVAIIGLAGACAVLPDSHLGLPVVVLVGVDWLATVDNQTTPWALGSAVSLAVFHAAMAASSVAPPAARWTGAMCRRWLRRTVAVMVGSAATWAFLAAVHRVEVAGSGVWFAVSLMLLAIAALWARDGTLSGPAQHARPNSRTARSTHARH